MKKIISVILLIMLLAGQCTTVFAETAIDTGIWEKRAYVDDFGDPTDEYYYTAEVKGTFSNSATTNSDLIGKIIIDRSNEDASVAIMLYEYGEYQVKNPYSTGRQYEVKIKDTYGTVSTYEGYMYSDRLFIYDSEYLSWSPVEDIFARGGKVQIVIQPKDDKLTKYNLTIPSATGYANLFPISNVGAFSEGKAIFVRDSYYGYINTDGSEALPCRFVSAGKFSQGLAYTKIADREDGSDYAYINPEGEIVFTVSTNGISTFTEDGVAYCYERNGAMKAINTSGQYISNLRCSNYTEGIAPVQDENRLWGYMDLNGNIIIPCEYTNLTYFANGLIMPKDRLKTIISLSLFLLFPMSGRG